MPNAKPLKHYIQAREAQGQGQQDIAAHHLQTALGSPGDNPVLRDNLDVLLDLDHPAGEMVLDILRVEMNRSRNDG